MTRILVASAPGVPLPASRTAKNLARKLLSAWAPKGVELSLSIVGRQDMARLNLLHRGKKGATDVLSFPLESPLAGKLARDARARWPRHRQALLREIETRRRRMGLPLLALGDIVICHPIAQAQAREFKEPWQRAYARLLTHGAAHLLGYDHERGRDWESAMRRVEEALLSPL